VAAALKRHLKRRADLLSGTAKDLHRNAPRGGENVNRFGERRSAALEVPAMETGGLFARLDQGVEVDAKEARVVVNHKLLEDGTRRMKPRPLGAEAVAEFKRKVRSEQ
jgi:hypothetical protein